MGFTGVAEFIADTKARSSYQAEAELEREFIGLLSDQKYQHLPLTSEVQLIANLRTQLEKLNEIKFSEAEWERFFTERIAGANDGIVEKSMRVQENHVQLLRRDDGSTENVLLIDKSNIHNNQHQVINQYAIGQDEGGANRSLMPLGLSRTTIVALSDFIVDDEFTPEDFIAWLRRTNIEGLGLPQLILKELNQVLDKFRP